MIDLPASLSVVLSLGPALLLVGAYTALGGHGVIPGLITVLGFLTTAYGVHRLGRLGPAPLGTLRLAPENDDRDAVDAARPE